MRPCFYFITAYIDSTLILHRIRFNQYNTLSMSVFSVVMPKKLKKSPVLHPNILARLKVWGRCIRLQRVQQKIKAVDFCPRIEVSESTLRRIETGDPTVNVGSYLAALNALGLLDFVTPMPEPQWFEGNANARVYDPKEDDGYF